MPPSSPTARMSPYVVGPPATGDLFIGRESILQDVLSQLNEHQSPGIRLLGQRRIGKTSLLKRLKVWLPEQGPFLPIFLDLQEIWRDARRKAERANDASLDWVRKSVIVCAIARALGVAEGLPPPAITAGLPLNEQLEQLEPFIASAESQGKRFVLLIDELDAGVGPAASNQAEVSSDVMLAWINSIGLRAPLVMAEGRNIRDYDKSHLYRQRGMPTLTLSYLERDELETLIRGSEARGALHWTADAAAFIWEMTRGHALAAQALCNQAWKKWRSFEGAPHTVTREEAASLVQPAIEEARGALEWSWAGLSAPERIVAWKAASQDPQAGPSASPGMNLSATARELAAARNRLVETEYLELGEAGSPPRLVVAFIAEWIRKHKSGDTLTRELAEQDQTVDERYKRSLRDITEAQVQPVESRRERLAQTAQALEEIIRSNEWHLEARESLAKLLSGLGRFDEAFRQWETLFQLQPELGRAGLVETLIAKANQTADPKAAWDLARRAAELDPNQLEAWRVVGTCALKAGELSEAEAAFRTAQDQPGLERVKEARNAQAVENVRLRTERDTLKRQQRLMGAGLLLILLAFFLRPFFLDFWDPRLPSSTPTPERAVSSPTAPRPTPVSQEDRSTPPPREMAPQAPSAPPPVERFSSPPEGWREVTLGPLMRFLKNPEGNETYDLPALKDWLQFSGPNVNSQESFQTCWYNPEHQAGRYHILCKLRKVVNPIPGWGVNFWVNPGASEALRRLPLSGQREVPIEPQPPSTPSPRRDPTGDGCGQGQTRVLIQFARPIDMLFVNGQQCELIQSQGRATCKAVVPEGKLLGLRWAGNGSNYSQEDLEKWESTGKLLEAEHNAAIAPAGGKACEWQRFRINN